MAARRGEIVSSWLGLRGVVSHTVVLGLSGEEWCSMGISISVR